MNDRRRFAFHAAGALGALALAPQRALANELQRIMRVPDGVARMLDRADQPSAEVLAQDESFWAEVRKSYALRADVVNLDHGWTNPAPASSLDELTRGLRQLEGLPAEELERMWLDITNKTVRAALSEVMGVPGNQISIVRNATEALDTVLLGLPLRAGDEVVCSAHV